jgi:hypothetical protein
VSIKTINFVWQNSKQRGSALLVLLAIADFANDDGEAWPSIRSLAKKARMSERNVNHILREKLSGEVEIRVNGSKFRTNLFRLPIDRDANDTLKTFHPDADFTQTLKPTSGVRMKPASSKPSLRTINESSKVATETSSSCGRRRKSSSADPQQLAAFETFYRAYPRHVARNAALSAWVKLDPDSDLQTVIMTAVARYAIDVQHTEPKYIAYPATWLNGRRWDDEVSSSIGEVNDVKLKEIFADEA